MFQREFEANLTVRILLALYAFDSFSRCVFTLKKKKKTVDNFDCPVNAKDEVFDTKERAVAPAKAPEILRIKKAVIT